MNTMLTKNDNHYILPFEFEIGLTMARNALCVFLACCIFLFSTSRLMACYTEREIANQEQKVLAGGAAVIVALATVESGVGAVALALLIWNLSNDCETLDIMNDDKCCP